MPTSSSLRFLTALALGLALGACSQPNGGTATGDNASASNSPNASSGNAGDHAGITESTRKLFGGAAPTDVRESPIKGLMEVYVSGNVFYASPDGKYFMQGDMIEVATMKSQTEAARSAPRAEAMKDLDTASSITYKARNEKYEVYVFTDVTCPYCTKLHQEMDSYNDAGITVHYFAWPRAGAGSPAYNDMVSAWCAKDQKGAINKLFHHDSIKKATCDNPVDEHIELGRRLMVNGTPAIFTADARQHGGYVSAQDLIKSIEAGQDTQGQQDH